MKAYTTIEQSHKLAEILPLESADMWYEDSGLIIPRLGHIPKEHSDTEVPCWSLAALINALPSATLDSSRDNYCRIHCMGRFTEWYKNSVDACVTMIEKLNELKLL